MTTLRTHLFALLGLGALAGTASANAFYINEHDGRGTGRGGAVAATTEGPASIVFNPGGIALSEGTRFALTATFLNVNGSYYDASNNNARTDTDSDPAVLPSVGITHRINDLVAVGVAFHLPFGLAASWEANHPQAGTIQDESLRSYFITPAVGLNLNKFVPGLSVGAGLDLVPATVKLERAIIFGDTQGTAVLGGDAFGIGGRLGVEYHPAALKQLHLGAMWRSQVTLDFKGKGDFDIDPAFRAALPPDGDISTSIKLPMALAGGVAYNVTPELQVELNATWLNWSKFKELAIKLPDGSESVAPENYKDTVTVRVGAEYQLLKKKAAVRIGYAYDPTPIPNTTITAQLPDGDRHVFFAGGSYAFGNYNVHLSLGYLPTTSQTTSDAEYMPVFKGKYEVSAFLAGLAVDGTFGK